MAARDDLRAWLKRRNMGHAAFADLVGVSVSAVDRWLSTDSTQQRRPRTAAAFAIEDATDGAVLARAWLRRSTSLPTP